MTGDKKTVINWLLDQDDELFDITLHKKKRSTDANAFYWTLCGKLAQKANTSAESIYRMHIKDMSVYECMLMVTDAVDSFKQKWTRNHLGRFVLTKESKEPGRTIVLAYYGSSDFDRAQMSRLIDNLIEDCNLYGVETASKEDIAKLVNAWGKN